MNTFVHSLKKNSRGFTLIELLVAIAIIGVLAAVLIANMVGVRERGSDAKIKNDLTQVRTALRLYYNDNQRYPSGNGTCRGVLGNPGATFQSSDGSSLYMRDLPEECHYENIGLDSFVLYADLNNDGDPAANESADRCGQTPVTGRYFVCAD